MERVNAVHRAYGRTMPDQRGRPSGSRTRGGINAPRTASCMGPHKTSAQAPRARLDCDRRIARVNLDDPRSRPPQRSASVARPPVAVGAERRKRGAAQLSQDAHGDPRAVWRLYDAESEGLILGPQRRPLAARASLLMHAGTAHDQVTLLAALGGLKVSGLEELSAEIRASHGRLSQDGEAAGF